MIANNVVPAEHGNHSPFGEWSGRTVLGAIQEKFRNCPTTPHNSRVAATSGDTEATWPWRTRLWFGVRLSAAARPGNDIQAERHHGAEFSPEVDQDVGPYPKRWGTGQCIAQ